MIHVEDSKEGAGYTRGGADEAQARIHALSLTDFIRVMRSLQKLEDALVEYGRKWQDICYWGRGCPFPDEKKAKDTAQVEWRKAVVEAAGKPRNGSARR